MKPTRARPLTIVADDLTGACDTGALFAARAPVPVSIWPRRAAADAVVRVVDTESRTLSGPDAAERAATVAAGGRARHWFKKIDSTLRGPIGAEVDALMRATGIATAIVCPAFPAQRRVVLDRALLVAGTPVAATPIARDPTFPAGAGSSVVDLLRPQLDRALAWIPIDQLRAGADALAARLRRLAGTAIVARLVEQAVAAIERERWDLVVVTGGETAVALWSALGADRMEVAGAPAPGLALGHLRLAGREPQAVLTKRSEEHTSELQSPCNLVCRLLLEKKKKAIPNERQQTPTSRAG